MDKGLLECPICHVAPKIGYACGDYFMHCTDGCPSPACDHAAETTTACAWNDWVAWYNKYLPAQPSEKPEPLTLEQLRGMDGEPVWVQELPPYTTAGYKVLAAPAVNEYGDICFDGGDCYAPYDYGKTWLAYRAKPERSEGK